MPVEDSMLDANGQPIPPDEARFFALLAEKPFTGQDAANRNDDHCPQMQGQNGGVMLDAGGDPIDPREAGIFEVFDDAT